MKNKIELPQMFTSDNGKYSYCLTRTHLKDDRFGYSLPLKNLKRVRGKRPRLVRVWDGGNHRFPLSPISPKFARIGCRRFSPQDFKLILKVADAL
jgi:hypothetical protein